MLPCHKTNVNYLYLQDKTDKDNKEEFVHLTTMPWNPYVSSPDVVGRQQELSKLSSYLEYLQEQTAYDKRATNLLQLAREKYMDMALTEYDSKQMLEAENREWAWSPIFQVLLGYLPQSAPMRPWKHTEDELMAILGAVQGDYYRTQTTLEYDCPHVVRVLKIQQRLSKSRFTPLSHPMLGITRQRLLEMATNPVDSQRLLLCAQQLSVFGWILFPCIGCNPVESLSNCSQDVYSLIGGESVENEAVLQKTHSFFSRVALRALLDMRQRTETYRHLLTMWTRSHSNLDTTAKAESLQVQYLTYNLWCL